MRRLFASALFALLALAKPVTAQDAAGADAIVRQSADPATGVVIGQHVAVYIDVLFRDEMPRPPRVHLPEIPGIQAFRFETQGTTIHDTIGGSTYVGQRFEFALFPRRAGAFLLPPAAVTLLDRQGNPTHNIQGEAVRLEVAAPPGLDASQPVIATRSLTLNEQWAPMPDGRFKAGDAIVRTITREADDVPSLAMLDLNTTAPDGVRVYADPPDIEDHVDRDALTGKRVDRITYVFSRGGRFVLPAMMQPWWNLADGTMAMAKTPAVTIHVAGVSAVTSTNAGYGAIPATYLAIGAIAILVILATVARFVLKYRHGDRGSTEAAAFVALRDACATADAAAIYRAFVAWGRFLRPDQLRQARDLADRLFSVLFSDCGQVWTETDSQSLIEHLRTVRRSTGSIKPHGALPPLNPVHP
jgi:hypothetical protein